MKLTTKRKTTLCMIVVFLLLISCTMLANLNLASANAETVEDYSDFLFSSIVYNNESAYKVSAANSDMEIAHIPAKVNGISVREIDAFGFAFLSELKEVYLPETVEVIGDGAFMGCENLTEVGFGIDGNKGIREIGEFAFAYCNIDSTAIPHTIETIKMSAFDDQIEDESILIVRSEDENNEDLIQGLATYNGQVFYSMTDLNLGVSVDGTHTVIKANQNILTDEQKILEIPTVYNDLPVEIAGNAFMKSSLWGITITSNGSTDNKVKLNAMSFQKLQATFVILNNYVEITGSLTGLFANSSVETIYLPDGMTVIPDNMFSGCQNLKNIFFQETANILSDSITSIGKNAFKNCTSIQELHLTENVSSIASYAFDGFTATQTLHINLAEKPSGWDAFWNGNCAAVLDWMQASGGEYAINYELDGGENAPENPIVLTEGHELVTLQDPTKSGFVFAGWFLDEGFMQQVTVLENLDSNLSLYAKWSQIFTVNYYGNFNTSGSTASSTHIKDESKQLSANGFAKQGYTFAGWDTNSVATTVVYQNQKEVSFSENIDLYAVWSYTVTYSSNTGTGSMPISTFIFGKNETLPLNAFVKSNYSFYGWDTSSVATSKAYGYQTIVKDLGNTTLYAVWSYTVTYNSNTGTGTMPVSTFIFGRNEILPSSTFVKLNYSFYGWDSSSTAISRVHLNQATVRDLGNTTLYAVWSYTVTYNSNTGTGTMPVSTFIFGKNETLSANAFAKNNYDFYGWDLSSAATSRSYLNQASVKDLGNTVLYAVWSYTVTYSSNTGTGSVSASTFIFGLNYTLPANAFAKSNYNFYGWDTNSSATSRVYLNQASVQDLGNTTLYAVWSYTVSYNANTGTGTMSASTFIFGRNETLLANAFAKSNYSFYGWDTNSSAISRAYLNQASVKDLGNTTLYAVWSYTITYNANSGTGTMASSTHIFGKSSALSSIGYSKNYYNFYGWDTSSSAASKVYSNEASVSNLGNTTLYAVWSYTITYNANGGTGTMTASTHFYNISKALTANAFSNANKYFTVWSVNYDSTKFSDKQSVSNLADAAKSNNVNLYANWQGKQIKVTFDATNGSVSEASKYVNYGEIFGELPTAEWSGHKFLGWNTNQYGNGTTITSATICNFTSDITIYAQWEYTITFNPNGGTTCTPIKGTYGTEIILPTTSKTGYKSLGWNYGTKVTDSYGNVYYSFTITGDLTINHSWQIVTYTVLSLAYNEAVPNGAIRPDYTYMPSQQVLEWGQWGRLTAKLDSAISDNYEFVKWSCYGYSLNYSESFNYPDYSTAETITFISMLSSEGYVFFEAVYKEKPNCVAEGTLITLADGTQKSVELLTGNELLLAWNLFTGTFDVAPILFIDSDPARMYDIIHLYFSDGTDVKVIGEHAFWNFDLNQYIFLRNDAAQYIGHWFNKQTTDSNGQLAWTKVQLVNVEVYEEWTTSWSPVTYGHLCYYVNGMLSMPGATTGLINIFDVDAETMTINQEAFLSDIEEFGLFTYEEFAEIFPVPEIIFEAFGGQFLKISIGKDLISFEQLGRLIESYTKFFVE